MVDVSVHELDHKNAHGTIMIEKWHIVWHTLIIPREFYTKVSWSHSHPIPPNLFRCIPNFPSFIFLFNFFFNFILLQTTSKQHLSWSSGSYHFSAPSYLILSNPKAQGLCCKCINYTWRPMRYCSLWRKQIIIVRKWSTFLLSGLLF